MNLRAVQAFVAIADTGTFRAAATRLSVNASTVSKLLRSLEADLRTPLLQRTTRSVTLTPAGQKALEPARALLAQHQTLTRSVSAEVVHRQ